MDTLAVVGAIREVAMRAINAHVEAVTFMVIK
jgi:hypothetical protein